MLIVLIVHPPQSVWCYLITCVVNCHCYIEQSSFRYGNNDWADQQSTRVNTSQCGGWGISLMSLQTNKWWGLNLQENKREDNTEVSFMQVCRYWFRRQILTIVITDFLGAKTPLQVTTDTKSYKYCYNLVTFLVLVINKCPSNLCIVKIIKIVKIGKNWKNCENCNTNLNCKK